MSGASPYNICDQDETALAAVNGGRVGGIGEGDDGFAGCESYVSVHVVSDEHVE